MAHTGRANHGTSGVVIDLTEDEDLDELPTQPSAIPLSAPAAPFLGSHTQAPSGNYVPLDAVEIHQAVARSHTPRLSFQSRPFSSNPLQGDEHPSGSAPMGPPRLPSASQSDHQGQIVAPAPPRPQSKISVSMRLHVSRHVDERLDRHVEHVHGSTRKLIQQKAAKMSVVTLLSNGRRMIDVLLDNDGVLPIQYEAEVAAIARGLADDYVDNFLRDGRLPSPTPVESLVRKTLPGIRRDSDHRDASQETAQHQRNASTPIKENGHNQMTLDGTSSVASPAHLGMPESAGVPIGTDLRALREPVATPTPGQAASSLERQPNISVSRSSQPTPGESRDAPIIIDLSDSEDDTTIPPQQSPPLATIWRGDNPKQLVLKISSNRLSEVVVQPERRTTMRRFHQKAASEASSLATPRPTPLSVEVSDGDEERVPKRRLLKSPRCDKSFGRKRQASRHAQRHTSEFPRHSPRLQSASRSRRSRVYSQARSRVKRAKRATRRSASKQTAVRALEGLAIARLDADVRRPYLSLQARKDFLRGLKITHLNARHLPGSPEEGTILENGIVVHVDFSLKELNAVLSALSHLYGRPRTSHPLEAITSIVALWQRNGGTLENLVPTLRAEGLAIPGRLESDLLFFLRDVVSAADFKLIKFTRLLPIKLRRSPVSAVDSAAKTQRSVTTLTLQREMLGRLRSSQQTSSAQAHLLCCYEDHLQRQAEYIDSSGDIATICWVDTNRFFCGATAHSDAHNMQYNKPGNLLSGSLSANAVRSVAGHQIIRPVVTRGENATDSMRQTQDPWLYCSVTCTAYLAQYGKCFSGSYDHTVKIWEMSEDGALSTLCGTWRHEGNVNFVVTSQHHDLVATAADARRDAVRVYDFEPNGIEWSSYDSFEAASQSKNLHDKWAYYPATMQWASCPRISHFLLVGYSPRSLDCLADDVPRDKVNTGELCVWNAQTGVPIPMWGTHSQNVFEVAWHPAQPIFFAATSPTGQSKPGVKTQVRMFVLEDKQWGFHQLKSLDCPAADINEITVMPNGVVDCYVTASCTDGNTYVWDTAFGDDPIHVLPHGRSIDDQGLGNAHGENDNGVKFAAWGASIDRFYTGATDGVVKVWNVRAAHDEVFIRDLVTLSGGVTTGKFSPDYNTLLIGDATGKVHVLSAMGKFGGNDEDAGTVGDKSLSREQIIPHSPVPPPTAFETTEELVSDQSGIAIARCFIEKFQLAVSSDEYIGAVQGPDYNETRLYYDRTKYVDGNGNDTEGWSLQELDAKRRERYEVHGINLPTLPEVGSSNNALHMANLARDVEHTLTPGTMGQLQHEGIDFDFEPDHDFDFELGPVVGQAISTRAQGVDKDGDSYMSSGDEEDEQPLTEEELAKLAKLRAQVQHQLAVHQVLSQLF